MAARRDPALLFPLDLPLSSFLELRVWNLINQKCVWKHSAHRGFIRGVTVTPDADGILSAGDDRTVRLWKLDYDNKNWGDVAVDEPEASFLSKHAFSYARSFRCALLTAIA